MNQSRFKALKIIMQRAQVNNCPIAPIKTTLYKDTVSGKKVFVNEFKNNGEKKVLSFSVKISCFDEEVKLIGTIKDYQYNDVNIFYGEEFGQNKIIACPDQSINSFAIVVTHVELEDDYFWDESIGKIANHADPVEEVEIEMAPMLDDFDDTISDVDQDVALISREDVAEPAVAVVEPVAVEKVTESVQSEELVTPITLDTPITTSEDVASVIGVAEPVISNKVEEPVVANQAITAPTDVEVEKEPVAEESKQVEEKPAEEKVIENKVEESKQPIEPKVKKDKKPLPKAVKVIITLALIAVFVFVAVVALLKYRDYSNYNRGAAFMANGNYEYAINMYTKLGDYADSPVLLIEAKKAYANSLKEAGQFEAAIKEYSNIQGQEAKVAECYDAWAKSLVEAGSYQDALDLINNESLTFGEETVNLVRYSMGVQLYEDKYYNEAVVFFERTKGYEDSDNLLNDSYYQQALTNANAGEYEEALKLFGSIENYKDSKQQINSAKYHLGKRAMDNHRFEEAVTYFEELGDYEDSAELIITCYYEYGVDCLNKQDYENAMNCFKNTEDYEDAEDKYNEALYNFLLEDMKEAVTLETMELWDELPKNYEDTAAIKKVLNKYVDHVGEYKWTTSNDQDINSKGGFDEHIIVTLAYNNGEVIFNVDGHPVDLKLFVYKSGTDSDTYTMLNTTTITRTFNGKIHTYKKIQE